LYVFDIRLLKKEFGRKENWKDFKMDLTSQFSEDERNVMNILSDEETAPKRSESGTSSDSVEFNWNLEDSFLFSLSLENRILDQLAKLRGMHQNWNNWLDESPEFNLEASPKEKKEFLEAYLKALLDCEQKIRKFEEKANADCDTQLQLSMEKMDELLSDLLHDKMTLSPAPFERQEQRNKKTQRAEPRNHKTKHPNTTTTSIAIPNRNQAPKGRRKKQKHQLQESPVLLSVVTPFTIQSQTPEKNQSPPSIPSVSPSLPIVIPPVSLLPDVVVPSQTPIPPSIPSSFQPSAPSIPVVPPIPPTQRFVTSISFVTSIPSTQPSVSPNGSSTQPKKSKKKKSRAKKTKPRTRRTSRRIFSDDYFKRKDN